MFARMHKPGAALALRKSVGSILLVSTLAFLLLVATCLTTTQTVFAAGSPPDPCNTDENTTGGIVAGDECPVEPHGPPVCSWFVEQTKSGLDKQGRLMTVTLYRFRFTQSRQNCGYLKATGSITNPSLSESCVELAIIGSTPGNVDLTRTILYTASTQLESGVITYDAGIYGFASIASYTSNSDKCIPHTVGSEYYGDVVIHYS